MLNFFLFMMFTLMFVFSGAAFIKVLHISIQPFQWIDSLFGWQRMLNKLDQKNSILTHGLFKILGGCEVCFSHALSVIWFAGYCTCSNVFLGFWVSSLASSTLSCIIVNIVWYLVFVCSTSMAGLYFITKLFEKK
jgi:hypothetical protein